MPRVRFAPSPTGFLHIGSARTFIFNWLYARRHHGTMVLRIDDTDVDRNTQASLDSIFEGLKWLDLGWDELYHQSERHRAAPSDGLENLRKRLGLSRFHARLGRVRTEGARRRPVAVSSRHARAVWRRKPVAAPMRASHSCCAFVSLARVRALSNSAMQSMARNRNCPPTSKTSPCSAATAFQPITWPLAPTTSI